MTGQILTPEVTLNINFEDVLNVKTIQNFF